jgi:nucleotide-binding universal stress UspA family protein
LVVALALIPEVHVATVGDATPAIATGLKNARAMLGATGIAADISILLGVPETALARLLDDGSTDMLVIGAYGHSRIRSLIIGSTNTAMIRACKVPLVLTR